MLYYHQRRTLNDTYDDLPDPLVASEVTTVVLITVVLVEGMGITLVVGVLIGVIVIEEGEVWVVAVVLSGVVVADGAVVDNEDVWMEVFVVTCVVDVDRGVVVRVVSSFGVVVRVDGEAVKVKIKTT